MIARLRRWLNEPVAAEDDVDWRRFGRSVGRFAGGALDAGRDDDDSPAARRWAEGGLSGRPDPPRWVGLALISIMVIVPALAALVVWYISTVPDA